MCVNYERSFACEKDVKYEEEVFEILKDGKPDDGKGLICSGMCLDGSCVEKAHIEKNEELGASVGLLNALKNVNQDVRVDLYVTHVMVESGRNIVGMLFQRTFFVTNVLSVPKIKSAAQYCCKSWLRPKRWCFVSY